MWILAITAGGQSYKTFFYINCIKIDVIQGKIKLVESVFDVIYAKIGFIGLTPVAKFALLLKSSCRYL